MAFLGVYISKIFRGGIPPDPPRMSHALGIRLHDHSHDTGFATDDDAADQNEKISQAQKY